MRWVIVLVLPVPAPASTHTGPRGANTASRVAYEAALQNGQRQSRYLAAHIQPTAAQKSLTPDRPWLFGLGFGLLFILWSIGMLVYYSIRDRR